MARDWVTTATICCILSSGAAFGQTTDSKPKFLVSDVHGSPATNQPFARGPFYAAGRYEVRFASMLDLVRIAYGVDPEKVLGGPTWLDFDRFDVFAMTPGGSNNESRKQMLQPDRRAATGRRRGRRGWRDLRGLGAERRALAVRCAEPAARAQAGNGEAPDAGTGDRACGTEAYG